MYTITIFIIIKMILKWWINLIMKSNIWCFYLICWAFSQNVDYAKSIVLVRLLNRWEHSFISIKQECDHGGYKWTWNSQPFIKDIPAGNILLSTATVFSGSTPTKSLQMACITERTFYYRKNISLSPNIIPQTICHNCMEIFTTGTFVQVHITSCNWWWLKSW